MPRISFDTFQQVSNEQSSSGVGFFSLKNDGDEAVVRILHDSPSDFDILTVHPIKVGDNFRKAACIKAPGDSPEKCPLCKAGVKLQYRFFVHMIQYVKDERGNIVSKPVIWERSAKDMSQKLVAMIQEYGPLSDCVFKIRRNGKAGDMQTTYEVLFANPSVYRPDLYPKDAAEAFKGYDTLGTKVYDKNYDELTAFLNTGSFPNSQQTSTAQASQPAAAVTSATTISQDRPPFDGGAPVAGRPNRYY